MRLLRSGVAWLLAMAALGFVKLSDLVEPDPDMPHLQDAERLLDEEVEEALARYEARSEAVDGGYSVRFPGKGR